MKKVVNGTLFVFGKDGASHQIPAGTTFEASFQWVKVEGKVIFITKAEWERLKLVMPRKAIDIGPLPPPAKEAPKKVSKKPAAKITVDAAANKFLSGYSTQKAMIEGYLSLEPNQQKAFNSYLPIEVAKVLVVSKDTRLHKKVRKALAKRVKAA